MWSRLLAREHLSPGNRSLITSTSSFFKLPFLDRVRSWASDRWPKRSLLGRARSWICRTSVSSDFSTTSQEFFRGTSENTNDVEPELDSTHPDTNNDTHLPVERRPEPCTTVSRRISRRVLILDTCSSGSPLLRSPSSDIRDLVQLFEARGYATDSVNVEHPNQDDIRAQIASFLADAQRGDVRVFYFTGHGDYSRDDIMWEDLPMPTDWWEDTIQDNAQPGSTVATINMDRLSSDHAQRRAILGSLSASSSGSDANLGPTRITIPARPGDQRTDTSTFEIQLPETPEYYSDSIELLSIALDSISEIVSTI
ncbi:hypothetical protein FRC08_014676 [Ceratobasidium sp. 394]|nr:hypothetical protein FRC08_014676 [Ceratobasidium sp. 394]